jgi:hypothetical protein
MVKKKQDEITAKAGEVITLSTGVKARIRAVASSLIDDMVSRIEIPEPPTWVNPEKEREEPNPDDPKYLKELRNAWKAQGEASLDAMVLFGVELVDGVPSIDEWLPKLKFLEKRKRLDLSDYDLTDDLELEFVYKRFVAISSVDYNLITRLSGVTQEAVEEAEEVFKSGEERGQDRGSPAQ